MMESQRRKEKIPEAFCSKHINNEEVINEPAVMDSLKILLLEFKWTKVTWKESNDGRG